MGDHLPHGLGTGGVPGPGGEKIDGEAPAAVDIRGMGIHLEDGGKGGDKKQGNVRVHLEKAEHGYAVHS